METKALRVNYLEQDLEDMLSKTEIELTAQLLIDAKQHGIVGKPIDANFYNVQTRSKIQSTLQPLVNLNYQRHSPVTDVATTSEFRKRAAEEAGILNSKSNGAEKQYESLKKECENLRSRLHNRLSNFLRIAIPAAFGSSEAVLTKMNLTSASLPTGYSIPIALAIGFVAGWGVHLAANYIQSARTPFERKKRFWTIVVIGLVCSAALGLWRAFLLHDAATINAQVAMQSQDRSSQFTAFPIIVLSFLFFLVALAAELKFWISPQQKKLLSDYEKKKIEVRLAKDEWDHLEYQKKEINTKVAQFSAETLSRQEYAKAFETRILALAKKLQDLYESTNLDHRIDNICPHFFGQQNNFDFTLYFNNLFTQKTVAQ